MRATSRGASFGPAGSGTDGHRSRRAGRGATLVAVLVSAALLAGCTSSDDDTSAGSSDAGADPGSTVTERVVERFDGMLEDFYRVPDPLPDGMPGDVLRTMPVEAPSGSTGLRIMYLTTDADDDLRAATGLVFFPDEAPADDTVSDTPAAVGTDTAEATDAADAPDGWPIVAWAHGTSGLAPKCAPSRSPAPPPNYGIEGVHVAPDYLGLGPDGELHPYLSSVAEGHAVIDSVAAARSLPETHAGDEWVAVGVSQGGHATLVTNEMAAERLPGVPLVGAAALAPGSELARTFGDELQTRVITTMALVGAAANDPEIVLEDYLSPPVLEASATIETGCMGDIIDAMIPVAGSPDYFTTDPRTDPVGLAWLEANDPGKAAGAAPLLVVQGGADILVLPARTSALIERLCSVGQVVELLEVPAADHDSVTEQSQAEVGAWLRARLDGEPPVDSC